MNEKPCSKCKIVKPVSEFYFHPKASGKPSSQCKSCHKIKRSKYYAENRDRYLASNRRWEEENKDRAKEIRRKWARENRNRLCEINREWKKNNWSKIRDDNASRAKSWRQKNPEKAKELNTRYRSLNKNKIRETEMRRKYGIGADEFKKLWDEQKGLCAICRIKIPQGIDHDHDTKEVRGLLCSNCNIALGLLKDNPLTISNMLTYLCCPPAQKVIYCGSNGVVS